MNDRVGEKMSREELYCEQGKTDMRKEEKRGTSETEEVVRERRGSDAKEFTGPAHQFC